MDSPARSKDLGASVLLHLLVEVGKLKTVFFLLGLFSIVTRGSRYVPEQYRVAETPFK